MHFSQTTPCPDHVHYPAKFQPMPPTALRTASLISASESSTNFLKDLSKEYHRNDMARTTREDDYRKKACLFTEITPLPKFSFSRILYEIRHECHKKVS